ncbi:MAG: Fmu (Sun) domain-containing protein, partial [Ginsengibacter sp.]
ETQSPVNKEYYFHRYLQYATSIIASYEGNNPFHFFLKKYFSSNKRHGSRDRKIITALCYDYFRLGYGVSIEADQNEKFLLSTFLCENSFQTSLEFFKPEWNVSISLPLWDKLKIIEKKFNAEKIFPFSDELSNQINFHKFSLSFLVQPKLFIRLRPGFKNSVISKLEKAGLLFEDLGDNCIAFSNNENVSNVIEMDKVAVVQDCNSQKTLDFLKPFAESNKTEMSIWDCCAGSGGKSILAFDIFKKINLTVSDIRKNILENLVQRFKKAGITEYKLIAADLEKESVKISELFDIIIADVPCTGSGTWARKPECLMFFKKNELEKYAMLQRKIVGSVLPDLRNGGHLLYITCSVFKKENEKNVAFFCDEYQLHLLKEQYLKGYEMHADTLFVALFAKAM